MFSLFQKNVPPKDYLPDSIFTLCEENNCTICSNEIYSPVVGGMVHDSQNGKVFCPFGSGESMNQSIYGDQLSLKGLPQTTWGRAPQLDPRPLTKIGLHWRTT